MEADAAQSEDFELEPPLLTAAAMLDWRTGGASIRCPQDVILTHQPACFRALAPRLRSRSIRGLSFPFRTIVGGQAGLALVSVGAPATAVCVEELAVAGARRIIAIDIAASLVPDLPAGSVAVVRSAACGDGTSPHYVGTARKVPASSELLRALYRQFPEALRIIVWSTDAPYRETLSLLDEARREGCAAIDMETGALYAASTALGIEAAAVLVIADQLNESWQPPLAGAASYQDVLRSVVAPQVLALLRS